MNKGDTLAYEVNYILDGLGLDGPDYKISKDEDFLDIANSKDIKEIISRLAKALSTYERSI